MSGDCLQVFPKIRNLIPYNGKKHLSQQQEFLPSFFTKPGKKRDWLTANFEKLKSAC
ncbi:MAG: hypothetical protein ONB48_05235 [candidate division KSB1 bacterium]|nr:hypothetical protein [candidate division KSB1 bacterium]MDZ7272951.1 hypothetical protein [candidate division KSB1 bacterium]MDZ7285055.1 hypothetical protein [candidate division KSB1 bacterium]MDZ7298087.1 hypothetical protein [candidate division KSB1 bacterium]MDZ7309219.1 hypothetical protein [candidate division KSB1 bacterium]